MKIEKKRIGPLKKVWLERKPPENEKQVEKNHSKFNKNEHHECSWILFSKRNLNALNGPSRFVFGKRRESAGSSMDRIKQKITQ